MRENKHIHHHRHKDFVLIELRKDELLFDIKNRAYVQGDVNRSEDTHAMHQFQDVGDEANRDTLLRYLNMGYQQCLEMLYAYDKDDVPGVYTVDDTPEDPEVYRFRLMLPDAFSRYSVEMLGEQLHEYMICKALYEWAMMTYPDAATMWAAKAEELRSAIKSTHNKRRRPVRRRQSPF